MDRSEKFKRLVRANDVTEGPSKPLLDKLKKHFPSPALGGHKL